MLTLCLSSYGTQVTLLEEDSPTVCCSFSRDAPIRHWPIISRPIIGA